MSEVFGAFNIFNYETIRGVAEAASAENQCIFMQTSASIVKYWSPEKLFELISLATCDLNRDLFKIHLDHCLDIQLIDRCIHAGWDSVMMDASHLPLEENIHLTKEVVEKAHARNIIAEGELGQIGGDEDGSHGNDDDKIKVDEVVQYVRETKVDFLAVGIGNKHGHYTKAEDVLDFDLLEEIHNIVPDQPLVLHGGSGLSDHDILRAIEFGIKKINISTEIKECYSTSFEKYIKSHKNFNFVELSKCTIEVIKQLVIKKIKLFAGKKSWY
jgi:fructose-bisphosphate aldolase class II